VKPIPVEERLSLAVARPVKGALLVLTIGSLADWDDFLGGDDSPDAKESRVAAMKSGHWLHVDKRSYKGLDGLCGTVRNIEDDDAFIRALIQLIHDAFEPFFAPLKPRRVSEKMFSCEILSNVEPAFRARVQREVNKMLDAHELAPIAWEARQIGLH
jgi:hypothetical protein